MADGVRFARDCCGQNENEAWLIKLMMALRRHLHDHARRAAYIACIELVLPVILSAASSGHKSANSIFQLTPTTVSAALQCPFRTGRSSCPQLCTSRESYNDVAHVQQIGHFDYRHSHLQD